MFKVLFVACMLALVAAEPKPNPGLVYSAYTAPVAAAYTAPIAAAYTAPVAAAYSAPLAYSAYTAPVAAYSAYTAPVAAYSAYTYASPYSAYLLR